LLSRSAAVLDLSAGDSFTDLYGRWRFRSITLPKLIALEMGRPLFLLPQTYGPFADAGRRKIAQDILRRTSMAWARDPWSYTKLQALLGGAFDPDRHREGVDVAFLLETAPPAEPLPRPLEGWLDDSGTRVAGINVSGLLYHGGEPAREQYGLKSDYRAVVTGLVSRLLDETDWVLVLVPHVTVEERHHESDTAAARAMVSALDRPDRVTVAPSYKDPRHVKWLISKLDWFCGTRMHSTIAAMSSGVPTAAIAYSDKTLGVFQTCGQGEHVADLRLNDTEDIIDRVLGVWQAREGVKGRLAAELPAVVLRARTQMEELATAMTNATGRVES
jgi:colanic acid/amylovoran biosynthesis protein